MGTLQDLRFYNAMKLNFISSVSETYQETEP